MSALLGKAGKHLFEKHLESYAPADPLYEYYTDDRGRQKKRKRELPPGLSSRDAAILRSVKRRAHHLDKGFHLCGMRFGWTFFISLVPVLGDVTSAGLNYMLVVRKARKADLPPWLLSRMMANNAFSFAVSFIPFVGDVVLAAFKANSRNAALLEEFLRVRGEEFIKLQAEVEQVEVVQEGGPKRKEGKGVARWFRKKSPARRKGDMSKEDAEQVKPGAGMLPGEVMEQVRIVPSEPVGNARGALNAAPPEIVVPKQKDQPTTDNSTPPSATTQHGRPGSSSGRSFSSFFSRSRRPSGNIDQATPSPGLHPNRGSRFVENISKSTSAAPSTT